MRRARLRLKIGTESDFRNRLSSVTWRGGCCSSGGGKFYHNKFPHNQCACVLCVCGVLGRAEDDDEGAHFPFVSLAREFEKKILLH